MENAIMLVALAGAFLLFALGVLALSYAAKLSRKA